MNDRILIAGGGIGGLATAIGLAQKGRKVTVLEKAARLGEIGAGIQLGPNAFHAFDYLGVGETARRMAVYIDNLRLMDALSGEEITRIPLDERFRERMGNPYAVVHRGDLHAVFLRACEAHENVALRTSAPVEGYAQDGTVVTAHAPTSGGRLAKAGEWRQLCTRFTNSANPRGPSPASACPRTHVRAPVRIDGTW